MKELPVESNIKFSGRLVNMTNTNFLECEINLLKQGFKQCFPNNNEKQDLKNILLNTETAISYLPSNQKIQ